MEMKQKSFRLGSKDMAFMQVLYSRHESSIFTRMLHSLLSGSMTLYENGIDIISVSAVDRIVKDIGGEKKEITYVEKNEKKLHGMKLSSEEGDFIVAMQNAHSQFNFTDIIGALLRGAASLFEHGIDICDVTDVNDIIKYKETR